MTEQIALTWLGTKAYAPTLKIMNDIHANFVNQSEKNQGNILIVEHSPAVVTMGQRFLPQDMLCSEEYLSINNIDFAKIDRGGSVTIHEPGQVVVYPIIRLDSRSLSVKKFVWILEEAMITVASKYGVNASRSQVNPGIWVGNKKLGAIGIRVSQRVSKHGLAFNINNSLDTFKHIIPCGLQSFGVTSLAKETKLDPASLSCEVIGLEIASEIRARVIA